MDCALCGKHPGSEDGQCRSSHTETMGASCEVGEDLAGEGSLPSAKCPNEEKGAPGVEKNLNRSLEVT